MKVVADLHLHTHFSDGLKSPEFLVEKAIANKLKAIAISDHDNVDAIDIAIKAAGNDLTIIPAIELSSEIEEKDMHILAYFMDYKDPDLLKEIKKFQVARHERALKMVQNINDRGINLNFEAVKKLSGNGTVGRPHIARAMVTAGYATSTQDAFIRFLKEGNPIYEPKYKIDPFKAIKVIQNAGGIAVWAHPARLGLEHRIPELVEAGLQGLEVFHPSQDRREQDRYFNLARRHNLLITGGSDYHGYDMGAQVGQYGVDAFHYDRLMEYKTKNKLTL